MRHRGPVSDYLSTARKGGHHKGKFSKLKSCVYLFNYYYYYYYYYY